jgi:hypothetical protein
VSTPAMYPDPHGPDARSRRTARCRRCWRRLSYAGPVKVYVIHENPEWLAPITAALQAAGVPHEPWRLGEAVIDLSQPPPPGVFWSRMSASSHTRGHPFAKDQLVALRAAGFDVPATVTVAGTRQLAAAARALPAPFISKHNQGGKGLGVALFGSHDEFEAYLDSPAYEPPVDGVTLLQEYLRAARPQITRAEIVGGEFVYAITADTARGGFQLCPADACAVDAAGTPAPEQSLFALRAGFDHPVIGQYQEFAARHGIEIAGFEFIETADGRLVTYDINTTTNYNAAIEAEAPRPALRAVADYLGKLLAA